jgi:hypothetical protein
VHRTQFFIFFSDTLYEYLLSLFSFLSRWLAMWGEFDVAWKRFALTVVSF